MEVFGGRSHHVRLKKKKNCRKLRTEDGNPKGEKNLCVMLSSKDYLEDTVVIHKIIEQDI